MSKKKCPVDRGKLLIALECCRAESCKNCPYVEEYQPECDQQANDSLAYICWLEEQLRERGYDVLG